MEPESRAERRAKRAAVIAAEQALPAAERRAARRSRVAEVTGVTFPALRVKVKDGEVLAHPFGSRRLGSLAGASAEVTDGTRVHRVAGAAAGAVLLGAPGLLAGLATKSRASAFVVFADGTFHEVKLDGGAAVRRAQAEAVRFNLLAGHALEGEPGDSADAPG